MLITYDRAQQILLQQKIIHIITSENVDSQTCISILGRFLLLKSICFTVSYKFLDQEEGYFLFINTQVVKSNSILITSLSPVNIEYIISDNIFVVDDGQFLQQFLFVFDPRVYNEQQLRFQKQYVKQEIDNNTNIKDPDLPQNQALRQQNPLIIDDSINDFVIVNEKQKIKNIILEDMFQQNQITFEKRQYLQMNPANIKSQEKEEEEYSVDVDQESNSESREISLGSSMQNFVVETQESQEINVNIHRQLWNQQQFQDFTQAQKTKIIEDEHQYQSDDITDKEIDNELTLESETESESVNKLDEEEQKIDDITQSLTNQIGRVHPQKFYKDLKLDISEEDLIQYFKKIQRLQKNQNNNFQELLQKYNIQYSFAQPVSITSTLIVFSYSSGIDFSDKNFTDQIIFSAFTGSINQYAQSQTDIQTIQKFETLIQSYILVQQDSKNKTRPFLTYTDYNIIGYRLLSFYQSLQISGLQHIINAHQASFNDPNGKINYLLTKLGISSQQANQPYQSMDKHLKRLIKKNYYFLSKTYKHSFLFYIPNFIYTNRLLATIEISSFDTALLIQHNPIKYAFQDFQDLAFHMQKAAISLDSIQTKSNYYHYLSDIAEIYQYQHMLINQQQYLKQLPSKNGYFIYHLTSETVFNNEQMSKLCQNIKYMRTTFDCLNLQQKAPNKLQNELYTSGVISLVPGFSGLKFVRVKFKPMDLLYQDCIVVLYQANKYFVHYCKSGFLGGVYSQYLMSGSQLLINQQIDIQKEAIQSIVNTWMEK